MVENRLAGQFRTQAMLERLAAIVHSSHDPVIEATLDGEIQFWNPAAELLYGYSAEEALGRSVRMLILPGHEEELERILARLG